MHSGQAKHFNGELTVEGQRVLDLWVTSVRREHHVCNPR